MAVYRPTKEPEGPHRTQNTAENHSDDILIREAGFVIESRPEKGPPTWRRGVKIFTHQEALRAAIGNARSNLAGGVGKTKR
jgi:hypothetical protein